MEIGAEELGQCEARHWAFGRCHLVPHPKGTRHWIEGRFTLGRGVTFTDAAVSGPVMVCEDIGGNR